MNKEEICQYVWNFLRGNNLPLFSISAVMGNIDAESEFNPSLIEVGSGIGFGLCQWSFERRTQLESYGTSLENQCQFLCDELLGTNYTNGIAHMQWINKSGYLTHDQFLKGQGDINSLTSAMCFCWERPNVIYAHLDRRHISANQFYQRYKDLGGTPETPKEPEDKPIQTQEVYKKICESSYNLNQLTSDDIEWLKGLTFNQEISLLYTFNKDKKTVGTDFFGKRLKFDTFKYKIEGVRKNGFIILNNGTMYKKYVNPKYLCDMAVTFEMSENGELIANYPSTWKSQFLSTEQGKLIINFS